MSCPCPNCVHDRGESPCSALEDEIAELRGALEDLIGVQNGPPQLKREKEWSAAMDRAYRVLRSTKSWAIRFGRH